MKKILFIVLPIVIVLTAGYIFYSNGALSRQDKDLPNCLGLHTGNVVAEVRYPKEFVNQQYSRSIDLFKDEGVSQQPSFLSISEDSYEPLEQIIAYSQVEAGPKYSTSTFKGYVAAWSEIEGLGNGSGELYVIPFGNRVIKLQYYFPNDFSANEKAKADKMLKSVNLKQINDDIKKDTIEKCG